jgi:hypothetical protein
VAPANVLPVIYDEDCPVFNGNAWLAPVYPGAFGVSESDDQALIPPVSTGLTQRSQGGGACEWSGHKRLSVFLDIYLGLMPGAKTSAAARLNTAW